MTRPESQFRALAALPAPNASDADGKRHGLWNAASPLYPDSRTTYVHGHAEGPFYWPGPPKRGWLEGILKPVDAPSLSLDSWSRDDARGVRCRGFGGSVALELRSFTEEGCMRDALFDAEGHATRVRNWDASGALVQEQHFAAGVPDGIWGRLRGKAWQEIHVEQGRVVFSPEEATRLGKLLTKTGIEWGDPAKFESAVVREIGHDALFGEALFALVRSGDLDPLGSASAFALLANWPGAGFADVDLILEDTRNYPCIPALFLLRGWPVALDQLVSRALPSRPLNAWVERARALTSSDRRVGLLFLLRRFGAELTADEMEEVGLALLDACGPTWDFHRIAVGALQREPNFEPFVGATRAKVLAIFGL